MTLRAIARKLDISPTAVSLALKGNPRISASMRARVAAEARATGYVPNARISELMNELRIARSPGYRCTLGVFSFFPTAEPWKYGAFSHLRVAYDGALACAARHGYKLDQLWLTEPGMTPGRFRDVLETRGIRGLLCLGSANPEQVMPPEFNRFAIVSWAMSISSRVHRIASHFAHDCRMLLEQVLARGYGRPGLIILESGDRRTDHAYSGTFCGFQERVLADAPVPVLRIEDWSEEVFAHWFDAQQPDVLIVHHDSAVLKKIEAVLGRRNLRVPTDIGLALLDKNPDPTRYAGIIQDNRLMGEEAIELLIGRICLNDFGPPVHPKIEVVEGIWNEGQTLPPRVTGSEPSTQKSVPRKRDSRHPKEKVASSAVTVSAAAV